MCDDQHICAIRIIDLLSGRDSVRPLYEQHEKLTTAPPIDKDYCTFCYVLGAPAGYKVPGKHFMTLFLDPAGSQRTLQADCFQIRCDRTCNTQELVIWADQVITTLCGVFRDMPKLICRDPSDMLYALCETRNRTVTARAYQFETFNKEAERVLAKQKFHSAYVVISAKREDFSLTRFSQIGLALDGSLYSRGGDVTIGVNYHQHPSTRLLVLSDD
jgi:hypothetical protein